MSMRGKSMANWSPEIPKDSRAKKEKLLSPNARENPETVTGNNELKRYVGGASKISGPFGRKGREF